MIKRTKAIMTTHSAGEGIPDDSSGEENSMIFQRQPMKSSGSNFPEKLGELLAALYFPWCTKWLEKSISNTE